MSIFRKSLWAAGLHDFALMSYDVIAKTPNAENHDDHRRYSLRAGVFAEN